MGTSEDYCRFKKGPGLCSICNKPGKDSYTGKGSGMKKYLITVTQEDIDEGCASDADNCPIAKAITRVYGLPAKVGGSLIELYANASEAKNGVAFGTAKTPKIASVFIAQFDNFGPKSVSPFSFELELPAKPVQLTLTDAEARTLSVLMATVSGSPAKSPRGHTESVSRKLTAAGVASYGTHKEWKLKSSGSGYHFSNYEDKADQPQPYAEF